MTEKTAEDLLGTKAPAKKAPAAKKAAPAAKKAAPAKKAAAKTEDLLGGKAPAKKAAAKDAPAAKKAAPAKKAAAKGDKPARVKEPIVFAEGEREELLGKIKKLVKKPISSRELAEKMGLATRKLRAVLYSAQRAGTVTLELAGSRVEGMTVSPA